MLDKMTNITLPRACWWELWILLPKRTLLIKEVIFVSTLEMSHVLYIYTYSNQPPEREAVIIYELIFEGQESYTNTLTPGRSWEFR